MITESELWAHSANGDRHQGMRHSLADHLRSTARLAGAFGSVFGAESLASALGLFHDAGKAGCSWQRRLLAREQAGRGRVGGRHWELGAKLLADVAGVGAMAVMGHHGGLTTIEALSRVLDSVTEDEADAQTEFFAAVPEARAVVAGSDLLPVAWTKDPSVLDVGIRMVFSALVDADYLDTAAHFAGDPAPEIPLPMAWGLLVERFEAERGQLLRERVELRGVSPIDHERSTLYERVVRQAGSQPGIYRLPAPTGSGKTITAAGFAVHHALAHGKSRVIMAVPFTTITEQNAAVYRQLLGAENVLEHHSQVEYDTDGDHRARLAAENWDVPVVVTTTVQLSDSLFGRRPARSRKLHRLANAVVVLDEVQALPLTLLAPILDALRVLTEHFHTTVLLTSATQPVFQELGAWQGLRVVDLVPRPEAIGLFRRLGRVRYEWQVNPRPTLAEVGERMRQEPQALAVVNTIDHAARMYQLIAENSDNAVPVRHLSTRMCPAHRRDVLAEAGELLRTGGPVLLVSTQLIEAGVDVDFPVVYRALAPAESLQQAAGRANREGTRPDGGRVVIFDAIDALVPQFYRTAVDSTRLFFGPGAADPDDLAALDSYYRHLYATTGSERCRRAMSIRQHRYGLDFESVADGPLTDPSTTQRDPHLAFRMIDDDTVPVVVTTYQPPDREPDPVDDWVADLMDPARRNATAFRRLRPYLVTLPRRVVTNPVIAAMLTPVVGELLRWEGNYHERLGVGDGMSGVEMVL